MLQNTSDLLNVQIHHQNMNNQMRGLALQFQLHYSLRVKFRQNIMKWFLTKMAHLFHQNCHTDFLSSQVRKKAKTTKFIFKIKFLITIVTMEPVLCKLMLLIIEEKKWNKVKWMHKVKGHIMQRMKWLSWWRKLCSSSCNMLERIKCLMRAQMVDRL